jgi:molybdopterin-synthase adenylyltransferase
MSATSRAVTVAGAGLIGSAAISLVTRIPGVDTLTIIDLDRYAAENRPSQDGVGAGDVGLPKALVQGKRALALKAGLNVRAICAPVEDVPWGALKADVLLGCLDNDAARQSVAAAAWRLGVPYVDAGVNGRLELVRVTVIWPGRNRPCLECGWSGEHYAQLGTRAPCQGGAAQVPATRAAAWLGSLAASLQAQQAAMLLGERTSLAAVGRQIVLDPAHRKFYDGELTRNPRCRFVHQEWAVRKLRVGPAEMRLAEALALGGRRASGTWPALRVEGRQFIRKQVCPAGHTTTTLRLQGRFHPRELVCEQCGQPLSASGFDACTRLSPAVLAPAHLEARLCDLGFLPGEVFSVVVRGREKHFELGPSGPSHDSNPFYPEEIYGRGL